MSIWKICVPLTRKCTASSLLHSTFLRSKQRWLTTQQLAYYEFGDPPNVLRYEKDIVIEENSNKLIIKMLASPINPADINTIQGTYAIKPKEFPAIAGIEGVGVVLNVGNDPNPYNLIEGSWVIAKNMGSGTWRSRIVGLNEDYLPIPKMDVISAATISVNPCTAYRMLKDFADLKPGDTVIQNGGNSAVGQGVIQLCRILGFKSISIVRDRENITDLKKQLEALGDSNTIILTNDELRLKCKELATQLALNCVGGKVATDMLRTLEPGGVMVTYGGMAHQPVIVPTASLVFKGIALQGFWMSRWKHVNPVNERLEMINYIAQLCNEGKYKPPNHKLFHISQYKEAITSSMTGFNNTKSIFTFD